MDKDYGPSFYKEDDKGKDKELWSINFDGTISGLKKYGIYDNSTKKTRPMQK